MQGTTQLLFEHVQNAHLTESVFLRLLHVINKDDLATIHKVFHFKCVISYMFFP